MGRPTKIEKRDHQLNVRLSKREICWVKDRARVEGVRPGEFARDRILREDKDTTSVALERRSSDALVLTQLSRLGNNLNQIARRFHQLGLPSPSDLAPVLAELRRFLAEAMHRDH